MNPFKALTLKGLNETCLNLLKQAPTPRAPTLCSELAESSSCANPHKSCIPAQPCPWLMQLNVITLCALVRYVILLTISTGTDFRQQVDFKGDVHAMEYVINITFPRYFRVSEGRLWE